MHKRKYQIKVEYLVEHRTVGTADAIRKVSTGLPIHAEHVKIQVLTSQKIDPLYDKEPNEQEPEVQELKQEPALPCEAQTELPQAESEVELRTNSAGYRQA